VFRLSVKDTGCGISEEDLQKLARPYVQVGNTKARRGGTGLGLHICRMLARAMGGDMEIESELGKGSTFTVTIQAEKVVDEKPRKPDSPENPVAPATLRILVAEDSKMNQMVLKAMFKKLGVTDITFADNGCEAFGILTAPDAPKFDIVLTDAYMPVMTGHELVAAIRANPSVAKTPVYLFTAEVEMKDTYAAAGFDGILLKPADLESLRKLLP
jgi:CheY-like chemotaxis protein